MQFKVATRLWLGFGTIFFLMLLSALVMRHYLSQADQLADTTDQVSLPMALMAADMKLQAVQVQQFLGLVESGLGVALVPETSSRYAGNGVVLVSIEPQPKALQVGLALACLPDALTPTARNFIATAHAVVLEPEV